MKRVRGEIKKGEDILTTKQNEGKHKRLIKLVSFPNRTDTYSPGIRRDTHTHTLRPISLCRFYPVSFSSSLNLPPSALVCFFRPFFVPFLFFCLLLLCLMIFFDYFYLFACPLSVFHLFPSFFSWEKGVGGNYTRFTTNQAKSFFCLFDNLALAWPFRSGAVAAACGCR